MASPSDDSEQPAECSARLSARSQLTFVGWVSPGPGAGDESYNPDGGEIRPSQVCSHVCRGETCVSAAVGTARKPTRLHPGGGKSRVCE